MTEWELLITKYHLAKEFLLQQCLKKTAPLELGFTTSKWLLYV